MSQYDGAPPDVTADDRLWAALIYFAAPVTPLIALLFPERQARPFIHAHTRQALVLGIAVALLAALLYVPTLGLSVVLFAVDWYYAYRAFRGQAFAVPVVTGMLSRR